MGEDKKPTIEIDVKEFYDQMQDLSASVAELKTLMRNMQTTINQASESDERSKENKREIEQLRKDLEDQEEDFNEYKKNIIKNNKERKNDRKWLIGTIIVVVGLGLKLFIGGM